MSLAEQIATARMLEQIEAEHRGEHPPQTLLLRPDATLADLWTRASADPTFHLGRLFVLRRPLVWTVAGNYERATGDVAVVWNADDPTETARVLLHELAHARRPARTSTTVTACWADERATEQAAHDLADTWGYADLFPPEVRDARLDAIDERCGWEQELILLVGLDHAGLAAAAYRAIRRLAHARQWSEETWQMALLGAAEDDAANQAVLLFDRSPLLGSYALDRTGETGLADAALPVDDAALLALRHALARCAQSSAPMSWQTVRWAADEPGIRRVFLPLRDEHDLTQVLSALHVALGLAVGGRVDACCWLYGDDRATSPHIYRLDIRCDEQRSEVWVLPDAEARGPARRLEAAWQAYLGCWAQALPILHSELHAGLGYLWATQHWQVVKENQAAPEPIWKDDEETRRYTTKGRSDAA
jgi:hypothetical protein